MLSGLISKCSIGSALEIQVKRQPAQVFSHFATVHRFFQNPSICCNFANSLLWHIASSLNLFQNVQLLQLWKSKYRTLGQPAHVASLFATVHHTFQRPINLLQFCKLTVAVRCKLSELNSKCSVASVALEIQVKRQPAQFLSPFCNCAVFITPFDVPSIYYNSASSLLQLTASKQVRQHCSWGVFSKQLKEWRWGVNNKRIKFFKMKWLRIQLDMLDFSVTLEIEGGGVDLSTPRKTGVLPYMPPTLRADFQKVDF